MGVKITRGILVSIGVLVFSLPGLSFSQTGSNPSVVQKKVGGINMPPGLKRGLDLGWDKGYLAGKAEMKKSVKPDPTRFEDYNDPDRWYRYEFGNRGHFIRGFRGGFLKGYSYGLQQNVGYKAPLKPGDGQFADSTGAAMGLPDFQGQAQTAPAKKRRPVKKTAKEKYNQVIMDAL